jgi:hypothetical protein
MFSYRTTPHVAESRGVCQAHDVSTFLSPLILVLSR